VLTTPLRTSWVNTHKANRRIRFGILNLNMASNNLGPITLQISA